MPAGILREPVSSLKYADAVVITKSSGNKNLSLENKIRSINKNCPIFYSFYKPLKLLGGDKDHEFLNLKEISAGAKEGKAIVLCAIGNPDYFYNNLKNFGLKITEYIEFEDHHEYSQNDLDMFKERLNGGADGERYIITTLKDYVKLKKFNNNIKETEKYEDIMKKVFYLDFELVVDKEFFNFVYDRYRNYLKNIDPSIYSNVVRGKD